MGTVKILLSDILTWSAYSKTRLTPATTLDKCPEAQEGVFNVQPSLNDKVSLWQGDITKLEIDAIVNAANTSLLGGGGVDGSIHRAAGPELLDECETLNGCEVGEAKITKGYELPAKHVIHTVGPCDKDPALLASAYKSSFELALTNELKTIAFPCISTGIYGFPQKDAAHIALRVTRNFLEKHEEKFDRVIFATFLNEDFKIYEKLLQRYFPIPISQASSTQVELPVETATEDKSKIEPPKEKDITV